MPKKRKKKIDKDKWAEIDALLAAAREAEDAGLEEGFDLEAEEPESLLDKEPDDPVEAYVRKLVTEAVDRAVASRFDSSLTMAISRLEEESRAETDALGARVEAAEQRLDAQARKLEGHDNSLKGHKDGLDWLNANWPPDPRESADDGVHRALMMALVMGAFAVGGGIAGYHSEWGALIGAGAGAVTSMIGFFVAGTWMKTTK